MTNPTPLSPAAQAVMEAYCTEADRLNRAVTEAEMVAAALRAAADCLAQVPIVVGEPLRGDSANDLAVVLVTELLAIAAELEGSND